jgi:dipeptidyl aminopeptidase/acylaminoacyl peptidase
MSMTKLFTTVSAIVLIGASAAYAIQPFGAARAPVAMAQEAVAPAAAAATDGARKTVGNLVTEGIPEIPADLNEQLLAYQNARAAGFSGWTPQGGMLIATRFGETAQVHRVDFPMGMRRQITFYSEPVGGGAYPDAPGAPGFIFSKDTGGDENFQIYLHDDATGKDIRVSVPGTRNTDAVWSRDGKQVAWSISSQENATYEVWVADIANPDGRRKIFEKSDGSSWGAAGWSPDGKRMLVQQYISAAESHIYELDIASGALTELNKQEGVKIAYGAAAYAPDGNSVIYSSDEGTEFQTLTRYTLADGTKTPISADIPWDIEAADISPDGSLIAFSVNANGASEVHIRKLADNSEVPGPKLPPGELGGVAFSPDGTKLGFGFASAKSAGDAWSFDLVKGELVRWTESELGGLNADTFVDPELFTYKSFDGKEIPAFIYKPKGTGPFPVVISIHGGPEAQERPSFAPVWQYWVNELGIAVVVPNVRGSSGYGKSYLELDNGFKRKDSVKDIGALLDWIGAQADLNKEKVMVYGGSYGGYMVNASMVDYSDRLAGGVSIVGISSFVTFLENTSGYRQDLRRVEYGDERDPAMRKFQEEIAPLANASKITKPIFIIHGANDPRVPVTEADQLFAAVKANGQNPWWLVALDEGHGFRKKSNRDYMNAAVALFFKGRLLGQGTGN